MRCNHELKVTIDGWTHHMRCRRDRAHNDHPNPVHTSHDEFQVYTMQWKSGAPGDVKVRDDATAELWDTLECYFGRAEDVEEIERIIRESGFVLKPAGE